MYKCRPIKIVIASNNPGKVKEISRIINHPSIKYLSLVQAHGKEIEIEETGESFLENSLIKAKSVAKITEKPAIADDSGLEVDVLDGAPGIYSARFAGENATDRENNEKLLKMLEGVVEEKRTARFRCVAVAYFPKFDIYFSSDGTCEGTIVFKPEGVYGFGYDPLFKPLGYEKTFGQIEPSTKNKISHRAKAFKHLRRKVLDFLEL